jgi:hypothetical protein
LESTGKTLESSRIFPCLRERKRKAGWLAWIIAWEKFMKEVNIVSNGYDAPSQGVFYQFNAVTDI